MDPHKASFVGWGCCILFIDHFEPVTKLPVVPVHFGISVFFLGGWIFCLSVFCWLFLLRFSFTLVFSKSCERDNRFVTQHSSPSWVTQNSSCASVIVKQETIPDMDIRSWSNQSCLGGRSKRVCHFFCGGSTFLLILPPGIPGIIKLPTLFLGGIISNAECRVMYFGISPNQCCLFGCYVSWPLKKTLCLLACRLKSTARGSTSLCSRGSQSWWEEARTTRRVRTNFSAIGAPRIQL